MRDREQGFSFSAWNLYSAYATGRFEAAPTMSSISPLCKLVPPWGLSGNTVICRLCKSLCKQEGRRCVKPQPHSSESYVLQKTRSLQTSRQHYLQTRFKNIRRMFASFELIYIYIKKGKVITYLWAHLEVNPRDNWIVVGWRGLRDVLCPRSPNVPPATDGAMHLRVNE